MATVQPKFREAGQFSHSGTVFQNAIPHVHYLLAGFISRGNVDSADIRLANKTIAENENP